MTFDATNSVFRAALQKAHQERIDEATAPLKARITELDKAAAEAFFPNGDANDAPPLPFAGLPEGSARILIDFVPGDGGLDVQVRAVNALRDGAPAQQYAFGLMEALVSGAAPDAESGEGDDHDR